MNTRVNFVPKAKTGQDILCLSRRTVTPTSKGQRPAGLAVAGHRILWPPTSKGQRPASLGTASGQLAQSSRANDGREQRCPGDIYGLQQAYHHLARAARRTGHGHVRGDSSSLQGRQQPARAERPRDARPPAISDGSVAAACVFTTGRDGCIEVGLSLAWHCCGLFCFWNVSIGCKQRRYVL